MSGNPFGATGRKDIRWQNGVKMIGFGPSAPRSTPKMDAARKKIDALDKKVRPLLKKRR